jgi:acetylornithine/N-succinyldiaminopimelate aminotransferase
MVGEPRAYPPLEDAVGAEEPAAASLARLIASGSLHMDQYGGGRLPFAVLRGEGVRRWLMELEGEAAGTVFEALDAAGSYSSMPFGERAGWMEKAAFDFFRSGGGVNDEMLSPERGRLLDALFAEGGPLRECFDPAAHWVAGRSSGSEGVELAVKLVADSCFDFRRLRPRGPAFRIVSFNGAWHGWFSSLVRFMDRRYYKVGLPEPAENSILSPLFLEFGDFASLEEAFERHPGEIAAVLVEPVQGDAGILFPPEGFLRRIRELCDACGALMVADEVMTFAKTGNWLACRDSRGPIAPDIVVIGKYLGMGLVPVSMVVARRDIVPGPFRHVCTNDLRPFVCAVVRAGIEEIVRRGLIESSRQEGERFLAGLRRCAESCPGVFAAVRGHGCLFGLELAPTLAGKVPEVRKTLARSGLLVEVMAGRTRPYTAPTLRLSLALDLPAAERGLILERLSQAMPRLAALAAGPPGAGDPRT